MDYTNILNSIPEKKKIDLISPKFKLEDAEKIHPSLTMDNELTYFLFLDKRPDLTIEERNIIFQIIAKLRANNETEYNFYMEKMINSNEYFNEEHKSETILL